MIYNTFFPLVFLEPSMTLRDHVPLPLCWGFLVSALLTFWSAYFFAVRGCPVHCGMFSGISGLYPLDSCSTLPVVTSKIVFRIIKCSLGDKWSPVETKAVCIPQFYPNLWLYPIPITLPWVLGYILTEKLHIQRWFKRAPVKHAFGVLLIIVPQGFVSHLPNLELHFQESLSLNFSKFLSLQGSGLSLAVRETWVRFGRWHCCLVSMKGGKRVRFCCNSHWMSWVCWPRCWRGPAWCVCGGSVGRGMAPPTPGSSSLSFSGFCIRLLQGSPAGHLYQWCYRLGGGERPMLVPTRARHPFPSVLVVPDYSSCSILSLFTFMSWWSSFCNG